LLITNCEHFYVAEAGNDKMDVLLLVVMLLSALHVDGKINR